MRSMDAQPYRPVSPSFFEQMTADLAPQLLNLILVHETREGVTAGRIVECEMYQGPRDRGAHSYGGSPTPRTRVMYGPPGHAYIYLIYGMYWCLNVVTGPDQVPHAILIRALQPLQGQGLMASRQKPGRQGPNLNTLATGPGKVCRAMGIDKSGYGHPLWTPPLYLALPQEPWPLYHVARGPRVNIDYAGEAAQFPWRFWVNQNPFVSRPKALTTLLEDSVSLDVGAYEDIHE